MRVFLFIIAFTFACKTKTYYSSGNARGEATVQQLEWEFATPTDKRFVNVGAELSIPIFIQVKGDKSSVDKQTTITSSAPKFGTVSVDAKGMHLLHGVAVGEGILHAEYRGKDLQIPFSVISSSGFSINPSIMLLRLGESIPAKISSSADEGVVDITDACTFKSDNPQLATVDSKQKNLIKGVGEGNLNVLVSMNAEQILSMPVSVHPAPSVGRPRLEAIQDADVKSATPAIVRYIFPLVDLKREDSVSLELPKYSQDFSNVSCRFTERHPSSVDENWLEQEFNVELTVPATAQSISYSQQVLAITVKNPTTSYSYTTTAKFNVNVGLRDNERNIISAGQDVTYIGTAGAKSSNQNATVPVARCATE